MLRFADEIRVESCRTAERSIARGEVGALISISDEPDAHRPRNIESVPHKLLLTFDDLIQSPVLGDGYRLADEHDIRAMLAFVERADLDRKTLVIHCWAGVSRSAAVGEIVLRYLCEAIRLPYREQMLYARCELGPKVIPNHHVLNLARSLRMRSV